MEPTVNIACILVEKHCKMQRNLTGYTQVILKIWGSAVTKLKEAVIVDNDLVSVMQQTKTLVHQEFNSAL